MEGPPIAVALDYPSSREALALVDRVTPEHCRLKVGLELFSAAGPGFVESLVRRGFDVFLDLKFHDIPNTVAAACRRAADLGVWMLTVHCLGGRAMLKAARDALGPAGRPLLVGVTVLTSHTAAEIAEIGLAGDIEGRVAALAGLAKECGLDGVVCAPTEAHTMRSRFGAGFLLVTPGVRPGGSPVGDQRRVLTPAEAIAGGADMLVVGRPITSSPNPRAALDAILREIATAG
ncbi:orotidine 5'-phosphate decarboxylase [Sulfurifustis variabilis]|uniref:Orotidine 5'-phosphate decarboxylase n=1 Tax=Sulfurifustis variabilis TaxID=1675686 RepID=A0A1B4VDS1_9GAMM|nr:orotidine-5'-phosphate decarboxylase [Sulfurifustis variabilis]BAU48617.1 orotidine 5'-phosphate decarboxylase [Sulfurifustis variabilis]